jgi:hypothetical protein
MADPRGGPSRYGLVAEASSAGLLFLVGPAAGYFLGRWLSAALSAGPAPSWIGAGLGLAAAFVNLVRLAGRVSR